MSYEEAQHIAPCTISTPATWRHRAVWEGSNLATGNGPASLPSTVSCLAAAASPGPHNRGLIQLLPSAQPLVLPLPSNLCATTMAFLKQSWQLFHEARPGSCSSLRTKCWHMSPSGCCSPFSLPLQASGAPGFQATCSSPGCPSTHPHCSPYVPAHSPPLT